MNVNDLWKAVEEEAGVERTSVPLVAAFLWRKEAGGTPIVWTLNKVCPLSAKLMTVGIFHGPDEVRVYTLALAKEGGDTEEVQPPTRMILTKDSDTLVPMVQEIMPLEVFQLELAAELLTLAGEGDDDEEEPEEPEEPAEAAATPPNGSAVEINQAPGAVG